MHAEDEVSIRLSRSKALALFEWAHRFMESGNQTFTHPADAIAVDTVASELERALPEVFTDAYPQLLRSCRERVVNDYRSHMGPQNSGWLSDLKYQDLDSPDAT